MRGPPYEVTFPSRYKPLPAGYRVIQLDSGHFMWIGPFDAKLGRETESGIDWDKYRVRRGAFADAELTLTLTRERVEKASLAHRVRLRSTSPTVARSTSPTVVL